ncbi:MAG TPA: sigma-70 family RNA polymerase sigma factor [Aeromicrobium sp.]|nr:sigma-70 family RNA polymerase sigma factor [Aeromicrobium sp.]
MSIQSTSVIASSESVEVDYASTVAAIDVLDRLLAEQLDRKRHLEALRGSVMEPMPAFMAEPYALLSVTDEIELAKLIEAGRDAKSRLTRDAACSEQTHVDLCRAVWMSTSARERFILANQRLVISVVRTLNGGRMEFSDRVQSGTLGLMTAVEKFDYRLGNKFSTYATWWIRQSVQRAVANESRVVRLPVHFHDDVVPVRAAERRLAEELGRKATVSEVAIASGRTVEKVEDVRAHDRLALGFDDVADEFDDGQDRNVIRFDTDVEDNEDRAHLCGMVLALLTDREALVLKRRSGFDTGEPETLDEIGRFLGVTRERVRQIEAKAKKRIRDQFSSIAA